MKPSLDENEWNFDEARVPDAEAKICCFWEYARESALLRKVYEQRNCTERHYDLALWMIGISFSDNGVSGFARLFQTGYAPNPDCRALQKIDIISPESHEVLFPNPWQSIPDEKREKLLMALDGPGDGIAAFQREPNASEEGVRTQFDYKWLFDLYGLSKTMTIKIEWQHFTDDEITACFRKWLKTNRPIGEHPPNRRGRKEIEWRVALKRLGIMRALHAFSFKDTRFPEPLKSQEAKACYEARTQAGEKFRELFHFLPANEKPLSWATKGGKTK